MIKLAYQLNKGSVIFLFLTTLGVDFALAQIKPIIEYDVKNKTFDTLDMIAFDTAILSANTNFNTGLFDENMVELNQLAPISNTFPNTQFTYKKTVSSEFEITNFPIRSTVKLFSERNDTLQDNCSGSLVSQRHVLTAAHCVSNIQTKEMISDSLYACPIYNNGAFNDLFDCSYVDKIYTLKDWILWGEDIAILELEKPIGNLTGWIGIGYNKTNNVSEDVYYKFSYPATTILALDSNEYNGDTLYYSYGLVSEVNENLIITDGITAIPGESGSSLIKIINYDTYISYGTLSASSGSNTTHTSFNNWKYYAFANIIKDDLFYNTLNGIDIGLAVYPTPASAWFKIKWIGNFKEVKLRITDASGKQIISYNNYQKESAIDISGFENGIYFMKIEVDKNIFVKKVVKKSY